jgi:rhodanese-related sulfurtransferase
MRKLIYSVILLTVTSAFVLSGCKSKAGNTEPGNDGQESMSISQLPEPVIGNETLLLLNDLKDKGDYVNSREFPSLIKASIVYSELDSGNLIIDLRDPGYFREGHIRGAVNLSFKTLHEYFQTGIKPFEYDKIILVCEDGQFASYTTALLRLMGYGNVYAMRWGMSGWDKLHASQGWLAGLSGKFESKLETTSNMTPPALGMPELATGLSDGSQVGENRFSKLFQEDRNAVLVSAENVFADPSAWFVINYERKDKYDDGHIPGAVRYKPEETLGFKDVMSTIPFNKPVVIYCGTGHNSAFATAYLRLFGYDARTLSYGNNSFMYDRMLKNRNTLSWLPFTEADVNDFPVVK